MVMAALPCGGVREFDMKRFIESFFIVIGAIARCQIAAALSRAPHQMKRVDHHVPFR
jgi:hypothetical protein